MHYWDSSALVPLCVEEASSKSLRALAARTSVITWSLSSIEIASAIERRSREGAIDPEGRVAALENLRVLRDGWTEITGLEPVRERALRLLATHDLRAADAMQLAAALVCVEDRPTGHFFVGTDGRLVKAAGREGFRSV